MDDLITALACWITAALIAVMILAVFTGSRTHIISGGISAVVVLVIACGTLEKYLPYELSSHAT